MNRRFPSWIPLFAIIAAACASPADRRAPGAVQADRRRSAAPIEASSAIDRDAPLDVRLLRIEPAMHVGSERVCDVLVAGQVQEVTARNAERYPVPLASRRLIRCGAATGEGWVDLVFPVPSAGLVGTVTNGTRLRVKVLAESGGFEGLPVVEFVATLGAFEPAAASTADFLSLPAGFDFQRAEAEDVGDEHRCVVAYVGLPEALDEAAQARVPGRPTHRASVVCKHRLGDAWVDLVFGPDHVPGVLSLRRGARASLRIVAADGGFGDVPVVSLVEVLADEG